MSLVSEKYIQLLIIKTFFCKKLINRKSLCSPPPYAQWLFIALFIKIKKKHRLRNKYNAGKNAS